MALRGVQRCRRRNEFHKEPFTSLVVHITKHHDMNEIFLTKEGKLVEEEVSKIRIRIRIRIN
jgi:hypothetical protein